MPLRRLKDTFESLTLEHLILGATGSKTLARLAEAVLIGQARWRGPRTIREMDDYTPSCTSYV
jgi:hypothetical protein